MCVNVFLEYVWLCVCVYTYSEKVCTNQHYNGRLGNCSCAWSLCIMFSYVVYTYACKYACIYACTYACAYACAL
jgi:hypothetical protein